MPLIKIDITTNSGWALWCIKETEAELASLLKSQDYELEFRNPVKKLEWLGSRMLAEKVAKDLSIPFAGIAKNEVGKPYIKNSNAHISVSHSYPYVAVQISLMGNVGIDIEKPASKICKVANRVFNKNERLDAGDSLEKNCIYWCAKEALYKIYSKRGLSYADNLHIEPFTLGQKGELKATIVTLGFNQNVTLNYLVEEDIVVVFTKELN